MYIIPTVEEKNDKRKPSVLQQHTEGNFVLLQPSLYTIQEYPLQTLYGFSLELFSVFDVPPPSWRLLAVKNITNDTFLSPVASLGNLDVNTYYKKLNTLYPLLESPVVALEISFVVFTNIVGLINDISVYTDKGAVLEEVNITGHIATFSSTVRDFTLADFVATKTEFPVPAALKFSINLDLSTQSFFSVYNTDENIGTAQYVLYNNKTYKRSQNSVPLVNTFTKRSSGALLWI